MLDDTIKILRPDIFQIEMSGSFIFSQKKSQEI